MQIFKLIILLFLLGSCSEREKNNEQTKSLPAHQTLLSFKIVPPYEKLPYLKLSELVSSIEYLKLETSSKALLNYGTYFSSDSSDYIFVRSNQRIYQFTRTGEFIRNIGDTGRGPNEFILHKMDVDFNNKIIYIYARYTHKIFRFDFNGEPIGSIKNELLSYPAIMRIIDDKLIFVNEINSHTRSEKSGDMELYTYNISSDSIETVLPNYHYFPKKDHHTIFSIRGQEQLAIHNNIAYYKMQFCDTLYQLKNSQIKPFLYLDFGKYKDPISNLKLRKSSLFLTDITATSECLLLTLIFNNSGKKTRFICHYNLKLKNMTYYNAMIINDMDGGLNFPSASLVTPSFFFIHPIRFKNPDEETKRKFYSGQEGLELKYPERKNEFKQLLEKSDLNDNPILQTIKLKK